MSRVVIAGGGLAGGLIALRLAQTRPEVTVTIVEGADGFGGNHTWSSFETDLTPAQRAWTAPLIAHRWAGYDVRFPGLSRTLANGYQSATSERLDAALRAALPAERRPTGTPVVAIEPTRVTLADQRVLEADAVIDARGQRSEHLELRWQKFVGLELELAQPHGLTRPVIMDATVDQLDGYRFVYLLPFTPTTVLVEDTYYADGAELGVERVRARIMDYAAARGWQVARIVREETGVLPIAVGGDMDAYWAGGPGVARAGMAAALFHPVTGYSLPDAVRLADRIAALPVIDAAGLSAETQRVARAAWQSRRFYRMLNVMLFDAAYPDARWRVLARFYRLPEALIARFYAGATTAGDMARILMGKPPVPVGRAVRALLARAA